MRRARHALWQRWLRILSDRGARSTAFRVTRSCLSALGSAAGIFFGMAPGMAFWCNHCLGQLYACVGEHRAALAYYEIALGRDATRAPALLHHLGVTLAALGRYDEAESRLRQSIEHKPWAWWSCKALGEILLRQRRWQEAQTLFEKTLQLNNTDHWTYFNLFEARRVTLGWQAALSLWLDEVLAAPQLQGLSMRLGTLWAEADGISDEQLDKLKRVAQRYQHCDEISFILGFTLARHGHVDEASRRQRSAMQRAWERDYHIHAPPLAALKQPEFVIFGNTKSGSTALYNHLIEHPLICPSLVKELCYWDKYYAYGQDWYLSCFMPIPAAAPHITGEGSISSLWNADAPRRVAQFRSDMKLLLITRDPVARAYSDYQMRRRLGYDLGEWEPLVEQVLHRYERCPLEPGELPTLAHEENVLIYSAVLPYLKRWRQHFSPRQFLVLRSEDLAVDMQGTVNAAYAFLGLPPHSLSSTEPVNVGTYPAMASELQQRLRQWFQPHQEALANYLAAGMA